MKTKSGFYVYDWLSHLNFCSAIFGTIVEPERCTKRGASSSYTFKLPETIGIGTIEFLTFDNDLTVIILNGTWLKNISYFTDNSERIRMTFSIDLDAKVDFGENNIIDTSMPSCRIFQPNTCLTLETIPSGAQTTWLTIAFSKNYIHKLTNSSDIFNNAHIQKLLSKSLSNSLYKEYPLDHRMLMITQNILTMSINDNLRVAYAGAKITELICISIDWLLHQKSTNPLPIKLSQSDKDALVLAKKKATQDLSNIPSTNELCRSIGINRNKFYYGFKFIFKKTLKQFINEERLGKAYSLLIDTDKSVDDIAAEVGFSHQSSFSTSFRKMFGFTAIQLRKNKKYYQRN